MFQVSLDLVSLDKMRKILSCQWFHYLRWKFDVKVLFKSILFFFWRAAERSSIGWILGTSLKLESCGVFVYKHGEVVVQYCLQGPSELYSAIEIEGMKYSSHLMLSVLH